jgi:hypothetical protein
MEEGITSRWCLRRFAPNHTGNVLQEKMKRIHWACFWTVAAIQFVATVAVVMKRFIMGMSRFDSGGPATSLENTLGTAQRILLFPVGSVGVYHWFQLLFHGILGWLPIVFNSLLWAAVIVGSAIGFGTIMNRPSG